MPTDRHDDPIAFRNFLDAKLADPGNELALAEILALWEAENQTEEERGEARRLIGEGLSAAALLRDARPPNAG